MSRDGLSKLEVDFARLLGCSESAVERFVAKKDALAGSEGTIRSIQKYISTLDALHEQLTTQQVVSSRRHDAEQSYTRRLEFLHSVMRTEAFTRRVGASEDNEEEATREGANEERAEPHLRGHDADTAARINFLVANDQRIQLGLNEVSNSGSGSHGGGGGAASHGTSAANTVVPAGPQAPRNPSQTDNGSNGDPSTPPSTPTKTRQASVAAASHTPRKTAGPTQKKPGDDSKADEMLAYHENLHDTYTDDMTRYTAAMRENAVATNKLVSQQMSTLNKLETHVDANSEMQQLANNALDSLLKSSSGSMWYYWFLMMTATIMFAGMYIFMKIFPKV